MDKDYWAQFEWGKYPQWLLKKVNELERLQNTSLFVRHSAREEPDRIEDTHGAQLTEAGKEAAFQFGQELNPAFSYRIFHSHVKRCEDTAFGIQQGAKNAGIQIGELQPKHELNMILSDEKALMPLLARDQEPFIYYWMGGHYPNHRVESTLSLAHRIHELLLENQETNQNQYLDLYVTHDFQLILLMFHWAATINSKDWVYYLDGFLCHLHPTTLNIRYHEESLEIPHPSWWNSGNHHYLS